MKTNWERGFRRTVLVFSLLGVFAGLGIFTYGAINGIIRTKRESEYNKLELRVLNDPKFTSLSSEDQKNVLTEIKKRMKIYDNTSEWKLYLFGGLLLSIMWFSILWGLFFMVRWIIMGFRTTP